MSRLSDALERAGRPMTAVPGLDAGSAPGLDGVPSAWDIEAPLAAEAPLHADAELPMRDPVESTGAPDDAGPRFDPGSTHKLVVDSRDAVLIEQYRSLATVVHHAQMETRLRTLMVASAVGGEGKTLTATNIALTLSHSFGRRVLLIDADLRRPSLHGMFQLPAGRGLSDCLRHPGRGPLPLHEISPALWVLPGGRPDSDPMSGLVSDTMKDLLREAGDRFDCVVIDTPPVVLMPDANLLAAMVDAAFLVVSAGTTPYPLARRALQAIGTTRVLGVILNRARNAAVAGGYSYNSYYGQRESDPGSSQSQAIP